MKVNECKTMDESTKEKPQMTFHAGRTLSELLEDSGNCRQINNQELSLRLLTDSLFSEQQKLRHVLNWAHSFLSSGSEVHHEFCRADRLMLVSKEQRETQKKTSTWKHSSAAGYHHPVSCSAGCNEVFWGEVGASMEKVWHLEPSDYENTESKGQLCKNKPFLDEPCIPFSFTPGIDEVTLPKSRETPEKMKSMKLQDATDKQTPRRRSSQFKSNQRQCSNFSDGNTSQTPAADDKTGLIKKYTSCWSNACYKKSRVFGTASNLKLSYKRAGVQSERERSQKKTELGKVKVEGKVQTKKEVVWMGKRNGKVNKEEDSSSASVLYAKNNISNSEPEMTQELMEKTSTLSSSSHLKLSPTLTVYEEYQLCVDHLHHLRIRQSQHIDLGCFIESPAKERKTSEEMAAPVKAPAPPSSGFQLNSSTKNPEIKKCLNKRVAAAGITMERSSAVTNKNQAKSKYDRNRATLAEQEQTKHCDNLTVRETPAAICAESRRVCQSNTFTSNKHLDLDSRKYGELIKETAGGITSTDDGTAVEKSVSQTPNTGLRIGWNPGVKGCQSRVEGQKKKAGGRGASLRLCEMSHVSLSSLNKKEILQRPQSSEVIKHKEKHTSEDKVKPTSAFRLTHKYLQPTDTHTPLHEDPQSVSPTTGACRCKQTDCKYIPAGVPVCDCWLCLPDEVWLSILCLLPHSDLSRVLQVCSRLHTLATDHSLWKDLRIENSNLTEPWLLCVGRRRPRSLSLYSCSGLSLTSCGLEMFFTLCRKTLEELKVTSCTGPGLHGDQMLPLIGQLCDHVTSVDVSWSGATDTGVKALSDCCTGLQLKSVVLNGCHVTDDPLMKLILRHKESLCRLEVFGCQFLTPSCLQKVYEMCPGLYHLNIGQVPKVDAHSLTVMTSQLKCLVSLNLTGLQAVSDAKVDTLLQNCIRLQSLTFSSCPGVTDLTLHSISKHTPCIRSLDVSYCAAVTDAGVQALALGCRRLQQLDLSSTGTGNRGVTLLANYCSRHLHTLKLSFCHITTENILKLCRRCKRLKVLHLYGCAQLPTEREIRDVNTAVKVHPHS